MAKEKKQAPDLKELPLNIKTGMVGFSIFGDSIIKPNRNLKTYREMRTDPTIVLARAVSNAPILTADYSIEGDVPDNIKDYLNDVFDNLWLKLIRALICGRDLGFQSFEVVWELKDGLYFPVKLKQLKQEKTKLLTDEYDNLIGCKYDDKHDIVDSKFFNYTHNLEYADYYGTPQPEAVRERAYYPWLQCQDKFQKYMSKVAGVIPMVQYPIGESEDKQGQKVTNYEIAMRILTQLGSGNGVAMPQVLSAFAPEMGITDPKMWQAWQISFLETTGSHGTEFIEAMRYYDSLKMRGYLVPERAATEGQYGTKAESETQGALAIAIAEQVFDEMLDQINNQLVNQMLATNFGPEYVNKAYLQRVGTDGNSMAMLRTIVTQVLSSPVNTDLLTKWVNIDAVFEALGIPKATDSIMDMTEEEQQNIDMIERALDAVRQNNGQTETSNEGDSREGQAEGQPIPSN